MKLISICQHCRSQLDPILYETGSYLKISAICETCEHVLNWESQRIIRGIPVVNLMFSAAVHFCGGSVRKSLHILQAMNISMITERQVYRHLDSYILPTIHSQWLLDQHNFIDNLPLQHRNKLHLAGDGRADSPGHSAKFLSYAFMCLQSNKIITLELISSYVIVIK